MIRKLTGEEAERFKEERCTFLDYKDIQEYIEDKKRCRLMMQPLILALIADNGFWFHEKIPYKIS